MSVSQEEQFTILSENVLFKRYLTLTNRKVKFPNGKEIEWDVAGHSHDRLPNFCVVFPFDTKTKSTTLISEYAQGSNELVFGFASGGLEAKHKDIFECAEFELSEEMRLKGGNMIGLLPEETKGIPEVKWCANRFMPVLVIDPVLDENPLERDFEEYIKIRRKVSIKDLEDLMLAGQLSLPSMQTAYMAIAKLKKLGFLE